MASSYNIVKQDALSCSQHSGKLPGVSSALFSLTSHQWTTKLSSSVLNRRHSVCATSTCFVSLRKTSEFLYTHEPTATSIVPQQSWRKCNDHKTGQHEDDNTALQYKLMGRIQSPQARFHRRAWRTGKRTSSLNPCVNHLQKQQGRNLWYDFHNSSASFLLSEVYFKAVYIAPLGHNLCF